MTKVPFVYFKFSLMYIVQNAILKRGLWRTEKLTVWTFLFVLTQSCLQWLKLAIKTWKGMGLRFVRLFCKRIENV